MENLPKIQQWLKTIESRCVVPRVGAPVFIPDKNVFEFSTVSVEAVVYLKAVRAVQSLKSIRILRENGLVIDFYTIGRCILDCATEIDFLLEKYPEVSQTGENFIQNFRKVTIDDLLEKGTDVVLSKKIRNASARVRAKEGFITCDAAKSSLDKLYKIFSGYVHSQYAHIMEIYGGNPSEWAFKVEGLTSESRKADYWEWIRELEELVIHRLAYMAKQFGYEPVLREIIHHFENLKTT